MYHLRNLAEVPEHTLEGFIFVSGSKTLEEAKKFYASIDLSGYASKIYARSWSCMADSTPSRRSKTPPA